MLVAQPILFLLLPIVLFVRMALNALDGMMARECNQQTRLGAILNETGDVISDIALYLPFLFLPVSNASLVILMLFCTILTEFCVYSRRRLTVFAVMPVHLAKAIAR